MTRQAKPTPEEKKEGRKVKAPPKKKPAETGVWPCKINGCNKQFAREADLKRHQRTTKLHSVPGFACPQCDATFTRTDALRRHQKSRHNGVIIEPADSDKKKGGDEDAQSSGSKSNSRSASPKSKDKETAGNIPATVSPPGPSGPPPSGPQSYYRQHTMPPGVYPPPPGMMMDGQYPPPPPGIGLPTSATRLHQASWPPPPWDPSQSPMGPMAYHQVGPHPAYYAPPYYRPGMIPPPHHLHPELMAQGQIPNGIPHPPLQVGPSRTGTPAMGSIQSNMDPQLSQDNSGPTRDLNAEAAKRESNSDSVAPVIDPSLDVPPSNPEGESVSLEMTKAAVEAVLKSAERESSLAEAGNRTSAAPDPKGSPPLSDHSPQPGRGSSHGSNQAAHSGPGEGESYSVARELAASADAEEQIAQMVSYDGSPPHSHHLDRPAEMEHMLTEDGEPMLNPAELLTQESLASPPPS
ncbi:hypothetical protein BJ138DRAFT_1125911 [Hygrophoropsis aurantiaca]|uniref:Uncharacterized protein n=1 Tax=Hygrophoropsis aurantiaca TaxID=72124 RepID=A0ACB8AEL3_9AGAM|nr:hypothetical protein BJ138DRAFT_1125911 [Hygrophoropsis aurantiaca]